MYLSHRYSYPLISSSTQQDKGEPPHSLAVCLLLLAGDVVCLLPGTIFILLLVCYIRSTSCLVVTLFYLQQEPWNNDPIHSPQCSSFSGRSPWYPSLTVRHGSRLPLQGEVHLPFSSELQQQQQSVILRHVSVLLHHHKHHHFGRCAMFRQVTGSKRAMPSK